MANVRTRTFEDRSFGMLKPEYFGVVQDACRRFDKKMHEERVSGANEGKYLIGSSIKPWQRMDFQVGTEENYRTCYDNCGEHEIIFGELI